MDLIKINPEQFGLSEIQATTIANKFIPVLEEMQPLIDKYEEVKSLNPADLANSKQFKELRLKFVKCRTKAAQIHKDEKAFYLAGGKYVDSYKNKQLEITEPIEADLSEKEKYAEIQEMKRKEALRVERAEKLRLWNCEEANNPNLGEFQENMFLMILSGAEKTYNDKIEAQKQAEIESLEKSKYDEEIQQQEMIWALYYQRIADQEEAEYQAKIAEQKRIRDEAESKARTEFEASEKIRLAELAQKQAEERAAAVVLKVQQDAENAIKTAELKAENDRKEAEKQKHLAEQKLIDEKFKAEQKAAIAPDSEKLKKYADSLRNITIPVLTLPESKEKFSRFIVKMKLAIAELN